MTGQTASSRLVPAINWRISPAERTIADVFNGADYHTLHVGKWHLYGLHEGFVPREHQGGWQTWRSREGMGSNRQNIFYDPVLWDENERPVEHQGYCTDVLADYFTDLFCERAKNGPVLGFMSEMAPHPPLCPPEETLASWEEREIDLPPNVPDRLTQDATINNSDLWCRILGDDLDCRNHAVYERRRYYAMIEHIDSALGRMRERLEKEGLANKTIIIFTSDHGEMGGSHGWLRKGTPFEESVGVPFLFFDPRNPGKRVCNTAIQTEDIFPSLCGLAGIHPGQDLPGADCSNLLQGQSEGLDREGVVLEFVGETRP